MKERLYGICTACILAILLGLVSGYEFGMYSTKVSAEVGRVKKEIKEIQTRKLTLTEEDNNNITLVDLNFTYLLPGNVQIEEIQKYVSIQFSFKERTKEILKEDQSNKLVGYRFVGIKKGSHEYSIDYNISIPSINNEDREYLKSNFKNETEIVILVENKEFKRIPFK